MPTPRRKVLPRAFYDRPTLEVARDLLGKVLVHRTGARVVAGMIVEAEAYIGEDDPACHAAHGLTRRNLPLYGPPGFSYVYLNYGVHHLVNAVTEGQGRPAAVLIRALEPVDGLRLMHRRRQRGAVRETTDLCRGPGNLTRALRITASENQLDLTDGGRLVIEDRGVSVPAVSWGSRIGIRVGVERPWRCWITGHPAVSGPRRR